MKIAILSKKLEINENGIWTTSHSRSVSYPDNGNLKCFQLEDSSLWFRHRNECILTVVKKYPSDGPILDVGGGNGYVSYFLIKNGIEAVLLEPGRDGAYIAKTKRKIPDVIWSSVEEANFQRNTIAAIGLFDVLEHIENDRLFIEQLHELLIPSGMLYLTVPAFNSLWSLSDLTAEHYRHYDESMLVDIMREYFDILYFTYMFQFLLFPIIFLRTVPYKLGLVKDRNLMKSASEHGKNNGKISKTISLLLTMEQKKIHHQKRIPWGTSCLLVSKKRL